MFCYPIFANYPKSLAFALKSTFEFKIHCKKHLPTHPISKSRKRFGYRSRSLVFACFFYLHLGVSNFFADRSRSLGFVVLSFGFQESNFSEFKDTTLSN